MNGLGAAAIGAHLALSRPCRDAAPPVRFAVDRRFSQPFFRVSHLADHLIEPTKNSTTNDRREMQ
jgi:hypothetical protein